MRKDNLYLGASGESEAAKLLKENGYKILFRNYKSGRREIDIIAEDKNTICFIEVKTRYSERFGLPKEAVERHKQRQLSKAALGFLKANGLLDRKARFDIVSVIYSNGIPRPELIKNAFELSPDFSY